MPKSSNLTLNLPALSKERTKSTGTLRSPPLSPPQPSPKSPHEMNGNGASGTYDPPQSPITALPQQTSYSPRERTKSIFSTKAFSKSQSRLAQESTPLPDQPVPVYQQSKSPGSTPELGGPEHSSTSDATSPRAKLLRQQISVKSNSEPLLVSDIDPKQKRAERKSKISAKLIRTKSMSNRDHSPSTRGPVVEDGRRNPMPMESSGMKTAPLEMKPQDRRFRDMMAGKPRNRSADRGAADNYRAPSKERRENAPPQPISRDSHSSQSSGHFFQNIRNSKSRASDLGRGFFGKITRSGSAHDREDHQHPVPQINPDTYVPTTIRLGLVAQTRATRISKRLESSRDKTEFWLPALPWRCIDYLNLNGLEVEGLYRVSGSLKEIKKWQMRFDLEKDVNLMDAKDLYDVNLVASLLKDWLRNLPEQILPEHIQKEVMKVAPPGTEQCPTEFSQALSQLPPFNYYLLFAITCHLSLLTSCYERTKMDFDNLCVCIQPSLGIDRVLFRILIKDWRNCWQGCYTEKAYLERENAFIGGQKINQVLGDPAPVNHKPIPTAAMPASEESRTISSAGSAHGMKSDQSIPPPEAEEPRVEQLEPQEAIQPAPSAQLPERPKTSEAPKVSEPAKIPEQPRAEPPSPPSEKDDTIEHEVASSAASTVASTLLEEPSKQAPMLSPYKPLSPIGPF